MPLARELTWRPLAGSGLEFLKLREWPGLIQARSTVIAQVEDRRVGLFYELKLDPDWSFRSILIQTTDGIMWYLTRETGGNWADSDGDRPDLAGCIDIDLSASPFTNSLPIRRARFETGTPQRFDMAWIDVATMSVHRDGQIYTRLADDRYRFAAADGSFEAEILVDADRLVLSYPPLFERA